MGQILRLPADVGHHVSAFTIHFCCNFPEFSPIFRGQNHDVRLSLQPIDHWPTFSVLSNSLCSTPWTPPAAASRRLGEASWVLVSQVSYMEIVYIEIYIYIYYIYIYYVYIIYKCICIHIISYTHTVWMNKEINRSNYSSYVSNE